MMSVVSSAIDLNHQATRLEIVRSRVAARVSAAMLSARLGVVLHARKIEHYARLISHNPTIVSRGNRHDVAGSELELAAVVHHNLLVPGENVTEVRGLAAICAGDRLDVLRPTPARLECGFADNAVADLEDLNPTLVRHRPHFVGGLEALLLKLHSWPPSVDLARRRA